jgi:hypothetical protein
VLVVASDQLSQWLPRSYVLDDQSCEVGLFDMLKWVCAARCLVRELGARDGKFTRRILGPSLMSLVPK